MADITLACDSVVVVNPPIPRFTETRIAPPDRTVVVLPVRGPAGAAGSNLQSDQPVVESPDGMRDVFTSAIAYVPDSLMVFLNGLMETNIINLSSNSFRFTTPPETGDVIRITFNPA